MTTFLSDTFTDTDGTALQSHTPNTGGSWETLDMRIGTSTADTDNAEIRSNMLRSVNTSTSRAYRNTATPSSAEYDITASFVVADANMSQTSAGVWGLGARATPTGTSNAAVDRYVALYLGNTTAASRVWRIEKMVAGTLTLLSSSLENISGSTVSVLFEVRDATKRLVVGGVQKCTTADNAITQVGRVALGVPSNASGNGIDTLTAATVSAGGTFTGTVAQTLPSLTQAATGTRTVPTSTGTVAQTLPALSQAAAGTVTPPTVTGAVAQSLPAVTQSAAGSVTAPVSTATVSQALPALTQAATGTHTAPTFTAAVAQTLPSLTQTAVGSVDNPGVEGAVAQTLPSLTQAVVGSFSIPNRTGTVSQTLPALTQAATGSHVAPTVTGSVAQTLPALTQSATGSFQAAIFTAVVAQTLPVLTQSVTGARTVPVFTATVAQTLAAMTQAAVGRHFIGTPVPPERTYRVDPEPRVLIIPAEDRVMRIPAESRVLEVTR